MAIFGRKSTTFSWDSAKQAAEDAIKEQAVRAVQQTKEALQNVLASEAAKVPAIQEAASQIQVAKIKEFMPWIIGALILAFLFGFFGRR